MYQDFSLGQQPAYPSLGSYSSFQGGGYPSVSPAPSFGSVGGIAAYPQAPAPSFSQDAWAPTLQSSSSFQQPLQQLGSAGHFAQAPTVDYYGGGGSPTYGQEYPQRAPAAAGFPPPPSGGGRGILKRSHSQGHISPGYGGQHSPQGYPAREASPAPARQGAPRSTFGGAKRNKNQAAPAAHGGLTRANLNAQAGGLKRSSTVEDDTESVGSRASTASSIGSTWRMMPNGNMKKVKKNKKSSFVTDITGRRIAFLVVVDDEMSVLSRSMLRVVRNFLMDWKYSVEVCVCEGNWDMFKADVSTGIQEITNVAQPGDSIFLWMANLNGPDPELQPMGIIERFGQDLVKNVRVTALIDNCTISRFPPFRMDHRQKKIPDPKNAGLTFFKRKAQPIQPGLKAIKYAPDIIAIIGRSRSQGQFPTFRTSQEQEYAVFTAAFIRAYNDKALWSIPGAVPSFAAVSNAIATHLGRIKGDQPHDVDAGVFCYTQLDIDQRFPL